MSIKIYSTQKKLNTKIEGYTNDQTDDKNQFITGQQTSSDKVALDTIPNGLYRTTTLAKQAEAGSPEPKRILISTSHGAKPGDVVRFEQTAANPGFEANILSTPDADTIILAAELDQNIVVSDEFFILRYVTPLFDSSGASLTTSGPIQFIKDAAITTVEQDTGTPGASTPLPVLALDQNGDPTDFATSALQTVGNTALQNIEIYTQAMNTEVGEINTKLDSQATSALQTANNVLVGAVNETAPATDTASSGLNGRLQRIAQRLTSLIALLPASLGQKNMAGSLAVTVASDQTAFPVNVTEAPGVVSTVNSTTTTLGIGGIFTGTWELIQSYGSLAVTVYSDQNAATQGFVLQFSNDGVNIDIFENYSYLTGGTNGDMIIVPTKAKYFRVKYTNGLVAQTAFRLQTIYRAYPTGPTNLIGTGIFDSSPALTTRAVIAGQTTGGGGGYVNVKVNPSGSMVADVSNSTGLVLGAGTANIGTVKTGGKSAVNKVRNDYTSTSVTTAAYVQLLSAAQFTTACTEVEIFDSSGQTLLLATGGAGSEADQVYIIPGGNGRIPLAIAASTRISVKAVSATASVGELTINFYG